MTVLITGGAGYIGTTLTAQLLEKGCTVIVVDSLKHGDVQALVPFFRNKNFRLVKGDIRDEAVMKTALKKADIICHLAGIVGYPACAKQPKLSQEVNIKATALLQRLRSGRQALINAGTGSVYGKVEQGVNFCTEQTILNPLSVYGMHKAAAEKIIMEGMNAVSLRLATAFGLSPHLRIDLLVNDFCYKAVHTGKLMIYEAHFKRTFIHVHDIARAFLHVIDNFDRMKNGIYNCGDKKMNVQKIEVADIIKKQCTLDVQSAANGSDKDFRNYNMSFKKINDTGFHTTVSLKQGIKEMLDLFAHYKQPR
jgi:nucleoside-diphosphate-sugar epimerase